MSQPKDLEKIRFAFFRIIKQYILVNLNFLSFNLALRGSECRVALLIKSKAH